MLSRLQAYLLERQLQRLEREADDDLLQVLEGGPEYYTNHELYGLLDQLRRQTREVNQYNQKRMILGGSISIWIGAGFLCGAFGLRTIGYFFIACVPFSALAFMIATFYLKRRFRTYRHTRLIESIIHQELERRRKDASIF